MSMQVSLQDNSGIALSKLKHASYKALEMVGMLMESYAKQELSKPKSHKDGSVRPNVITGRLRNSITHKVSGDDVTVGSEVEYAEFVELGTRKAPAYPYLKPAITEHAAEYRSIIESSLEDKESSNTSDK